MKHTPHSRAPLHQATRLALCLAPLAGCDREPAQPDADGKLVVYPMITEIGIAGHREFHDEHGRLARRVLYVPAWPTTRPTASTPIVRRSVDGSFEPNDLVVLRSETYDYDGDGRLVRTSTYNRGGVLSSFRAHRYDRQGFLQTLVDFTPDGYRTSETRYAPPEETERFGRRPQRGPERCALFFDHTGDRLIAVRGAPPDDLPWTWDWGPEHKGLCCAIAPSNECGPLDELRIAVCVRNVTNGNRLVAGGQGCYRPILCGPDGQVVPRGPQGEQYLLRPLVSWLAVEGGHVSHSERFPLSWWYPDLPPGKYSLQIEYRGYPGESKQWLLQSNPLTITIVATDNDCD